MGNTGGEHTNSGGKPSKEANFGRDQEALLPKKNYFPATKRTLREAPRFFGATMGFPRKKKQVLP